MATTRKRSPGFTDKEEQTSEVKDVEKFLDDIAQEVLEKTPVKKIEELEPAHMEITPTDDVGSRFVEKVAEPVTTSAPLEPLVNAPPKRHPRNIPKFSRFK